MLLYTRIKSPPPLIWMLILRFLSDTLMLFTTILWRAHFDSWVSATVDIDCSLLCFLLTQRKTATLIVHRRGKRGRLGETLWSSERSTSCSCAGSFSSTSQIKASVTARYQFTSRGNQSCSRSQISIRVSAITGRQHATTHTHARVDTHELDGFLLYLGFSPW